MARATRRAAPIRFRAKLPHTVWIVVGLAAVAVFLFVAFLVASFPYDDTIARLLAPYQLKLAYEEQHFNLPIGVEFERVSLYAEDQTPHRLILRSPAVTFAPAITSLIFARPEFKLDAALFGGSIRVKVRQEAEVIDTDFQLDDLSLAESRALRQFGVTLAGTVAGKGSASLRDGDLAEDKGLGHFSGAKVTLDIARGFPRIRLGSIEGHLELTNRVLTFEEVEVHGGDVEARANGAIELAPDLAESTITARLYLTPTTMGRDRFGFFFNLLPHPPAEGPYYVHGPITSPTIN